MPATPPYSAAHKNAGTLPTIPTFTSPVNTSPPAINILEISLPTLPISVTGRSLLLPPIRGSLPPPRPAPTGPLPATPVALLSSIPAPRELQATPIGPVSAPPVAQYLFDRFLPEPRTASMRPVPTPPMARLLPSPAPPPQAAPHIFDHGPPNNNQPSFVYTRHYVPPTPGFPTPYFYQGRDRFPAYHSRWHGAESANNPCRYEIPAGSFEENSFCRHWSLGEGYEILDSHIQSIQQEEIQAGVKFRITINPRFWEGKTIQRGDMIIFRGFEPCGDIRYVITWEVPQMQSPAGTFVYVQANALNQNQESLEHGDADWPTIGLLVPPTASKVARRQMIPQNPTTAPNRPSAPIDPSQYLQPPHSEQRDGHDESILRRVRRKISRGYVQGKDRA
jgi:hypothetical protein